jgi:leader peptidase (prepilin peptidase)/N-methyltransferase
MSIVELWLTIFFVFIFIIGIAFGSFLNVCIYRLANAKSVVWPPSCCPHCFTNIKKTHNLPLVGYFLVQGRCAACGVPFSMRYFWVELLTGLGLIALYWFEIGKNIQGYPIWVHGGFWFLEWGTFPPHSWAFFFFHTFLLATLIVASGTLWDVGKLPLSVAGLGALAGLLWSLAYPWPAPADMRTELLLQNPATRTLVPAFVLWPVWDPLPVSWLGSWWIGLLSWVVASLGIASLVRLVDLSNRRGDHSTPLGPTIGAVAMLVGGFVGWQVSLLALLVTTGLILPFACITRVRVSRLALTYIVMIVVCRFGWFAIGPVVRLWFFSPLWVGLGVGMLALGLHLLGRWAKED